jgi:hypothetical protein
VRKVGLGLGVLAAAAVALVLVLGGGGDDGAVDDARAEGMPDVEEVVERVEALRELSFERPPRVEVLPQRDVEREIERTARREAGDMSRTSRERAAKLEAASALATVHVGIVDPERDEDALSGPSGGDGESGVLGLYLPERRRVFVVEEVAREDPEEAEAILAHELAHALEDEAFGGFERDPKPFADSAIARHALHEGSATLLEAQYRIEHLGAEGPVDRVLDAIRERTSSPDAPRGLNVISAFPYADGGTFAAALHRRGGWKAVDAAHRKPPATTSAILEPQRWVGDDDAHERPRFSVGAVFGEGWQRLGRADVGQVDTMALLAAGTSAEKAREGAEGWEGGRFETWVRGDLDDSCEPPCRERTGSVLVWRFREDGQAEAFGSMLREALESSVKARGGDGGTLSVGDGAGALVQRGRVAALAFAPEGAQARRVAEAALAEDR